MAYEKNVSVLQNNNLSLSGSVVTVTGSLYGSFVSGTTAEFTGISSSYLVLSGIAEPTQTEGTIFYDNTNNLLRQWTEVTDVDLHLGQQLAVRVKNDSGVTLAKGKVVHITGSTNSDTPLVTTASYESDSVSADTLGVLMSSLDADEVGYILLYGLLTGLDLSTYASGDMLYLSSSGDFTNVVAQSPFHEVRIGQVTRATNNGAMFVRIQNGYETDELHDVLFSNKAEGDLISWDAATGVWRNKKQLTGSYQITGDITASNADFVSITADTITAREYHTELVSASIIYQSGSTKFGDTPGGAQQDTHQFSGSLYITGSTVTLTGGSFSGNGSGLTNLAAGQLEGTIPSSVLQNSSLYVGTTQIFLNRSSSTQTLNGVSIDGNSATATKLQTARNLTTTGDVTVSISSFDGSANASGTATIGTGTIVNSHIKATANISDTKLATISTPGKVSNSATTATSSNTSDTIVARDTSGNFSAGTITATTLVETSTREIKENIKTIPNQLKNIKKLNPVQYNKIDSKRKEIGLIAEEVKEVYPEFVHEKGINYPKMVSILISAVQELTEKVEQQQKEIQKIKNIKNGKKTEKTLKEKSTAKNTIVLGS